MSFTGPTILPTSWKYVARALRSFHCQGEMSMIHYHISKYTFKILQTKANPENQQKNYIIFTFRLDLFNLFCTCMFMYACECLCACVSAHECKHLLMCMLSHSSDGQRTPYEGSFFLPCGLRDWSHFFIRLGSKHFLSVKPSLLYCIVFLTSDAFLIVNNIHRKHRTLFIILTLVVVIGAGPWDKILWKLWHIQTHR